MPTLTVSPTGDDAAPGTPEAPLRTIRRALEAAATRPGTRVFVRAGTYLEGAPDDDFALRIGAEGTRIEAAAGERVIVKPLGEGVTGALAIAASGVTAHGLELEGFRVTGVAIGKADATLTNVVLSDLKLELPAGGDGIIVWPDGRERGRPVVDGLSIFRTRIVGADLGITVGSGPIRRLRIEDVYVKCRSGGPEGSGSDAIAVEQGEGVLLNGVEVAYAEADGIDLKAGGVALVNVYVHHVRRNGIKLWRGGDVVNALVHDCGADASVVLGGEPGGGAATYRLVHAVIAFHNRGGESAYALTCSYDDPTAPITLELVDTVFYRNMGGLAISHGTSALFDHSAFFGAANGVVLEYGIGGEAGGAVETRETVAALARAGKPRGVLSFDTDPRFEDPAAATLTGFVPAKGSPLLGAGAPHEIPVRFDLLGRSRPRGRAPAIGPLERH